MKVLVLGGTRFLGRAVVDAALGRGDDVTLFNRGKTNPGLYPGLETIVGDRAGDLTALSTRSWDAVVDVAAYDPELVARSVAALAGRAARYAFVSAVSVYADHSVSQVEGAPVLELRDGTPEDDLYGARKAAAERIVTEAFGDRALHARAGLIVGPHDGTDRFAYWPRRIARCGAVGRLSGQASAVGRLSGQASSLGPGPRRPCSGRGGSQPRRGAAPAARTRTALAAPIPAGPGVLEARAGL
jgi:2'-hydroxyisoflavone reductase